jgi:hypothetical protein
MTVEYAEQTVKSGSFTAANPAVATTITLGWVPSFVKFVTLDTNAFTGEYWDSLADASFVKSLAGGTIQALISSAGVTPTDDGFTLGTGCQVAAKVTHWVAFR